jgi:hypothetical protein
MYEIVERTVIFNWDFNQVLNDTILNDIASCDTIIFNDYDDLDTCLMTNNEHKYNDKWKRSKFNQPLDNLPSSIINLTLGYHFNQHLDNLPSSIINLTLGDRFNQLIDNLPSSLINLTLGYWFNQNLDNLPSSIINLTLGHYFNQELNNLPNSIINLTLGENFNQCLDNLPHSIKDLTLGTNFNQEIENLPSSLNKITFLNAYGEYIKFNHKIKKIPQNLKIVDLSRIRNKSDLKKLFEKFNVEIIE